ncbi:uncharacterized protein E0L32_001043 [Thyridium curvatum]|uniref:TauD/TfdA-like domain-containing protein n=1 Tax=Thyridium curvatum TaxID=1093900 RepID=A0A507AKY4_9PEZI|nr:uncharacterized protein E0L32_001043 [Thyridium curvatum]TPX11225.1 hypothetical protein E0L32_001043 [Thyridium curvatum]
MATVTTGTYLGEPASASMAEIGVCAEVSPLPAGFPAKFERPLAWNGLEIKQEDYACVLTASDLVEINAAIEYFKSLELDGSCVSRDTFPLPQLGLKLDKLGLDLYQGKGFCLVRGIKPEAYSVEDLTLVYLGVNSYIGGQHGRQDGRGNMLVHIVADNSSSTQAEHHRHSNKSISFHNEESGDIVGWLTRNTAAKGGKCIIASAYTVYNVLAETRPDLIRILARSDWPFALPRFHCRPVIFHRDSNLVMNFGRTPLLGNTAHPRPETLPSLSERQIEALDAIEAIAQATQLEITTQTGDMHFINNLAVLHRREAFVDGDQAKRHLVRVRLRSPELGWELPEELQKEWDTAFSEEGNQTWHLEPMPSGYFPLRMYPN